MKRFIEVTKIGGNTKTLLQTKLITEVEEPGDSSHTHTYVLITYKDDELIRVQESYEKIKQLLEEAE